MKLPVLIPCELNKGFQHPVKKSLVNSQNMYYSSVLQQQPRLEN